MHAVASLCILLFSKVEQYFMYMYTQHILFLMSSTILAVNVSPVNTMRGQGLARVPFVGLCLSGKEQRE